MPNKPDRSLLLNPTRGLLNMGKLSRLAGILVCSATVAATGLSASAGVARFVAPQYHAQPLQGAKYIGNGWWNDNGVTYRTHIMKTLQHASKVRPDTGALSYHGGPVLTSPHTYLILWGYAAAGDPDHLAKLIKAYLKAVGGSPLENIATQYYGPGSVHITNPTGQFKGVWKDNTNPIPAHATQGQVAAEAVKGSAHFGFDANGSYVVALAHNHGSQGFGTSFCAFHGATSASGGTISFTNLDYMPDQGSNCGANIISPPSDETGTDEGVTIVEGHEMMESITDPQLNAWWDSGNGEEIGDLCAWINIQNDPMNGKSYSSQPEYSDASSSCVHSF
jgi:hypothetical protein